MVKSSLDMINEEREWTISGMKMESERSWKPKSMPCAVSVWNQEKIEGARPVCSSQASVFVNTFLNIWEMLLRLLCSTPHFYYLYFLVFMYYICGCCCDTHLAFPNLLGTEDFAVSVLLYSSQSGLLIIKYELPFWSFIVCWRLASLHDFFFIWFSFDLSLIPYAGTGIDQHTCNWIP